VSRHAAHDRPIRATKMLRDRDVLSQQLTSATPFRSLKSISMDNMSGRTMSPSHDEEKDQGFCRNVVVTCHRSSRGC
jgi:hypothetical protein